MLALALALLGVVVAWNVDERVTAVFRRFSIGWVEGHAVPNLAMHTWKPSVVLYGAANRHSHLSRNDQGPVFKVEEFGRNEFHYRDCMISWGGPFSGSECPLNFRWIWRFSIKEYDRTRSGDVGGMASRIAYLESHSRASIEDAELKSDEIQHRSFAYDKGAGSRVGRLTSVDTLKQEQQKLQRADYSTNYYQPSCIANIPPVERQQFPRYGYVFVGIAGAIRVALGGWIWGYYERPWCGALVAFVGLSTYVIDLLWLFATGT